MKSLKGSAAEFFAESCEKKGGKYLISGRSVFQSPEIDGNTLVLSDRALETGRFYKSVIKNHVGYNIKAELRHIAAGAAQTGKKK
jgi:ribosomal protein S12 methylthiotransferase